MKKLFLSVLASFICFNSFAQTDNKITIGSIDSIKSKILNEKRKIWIYKPKDNTDSIFLPQRYPVVYLLDGNLHFSSVVGMLQQMAGTGVCPEMIVVGIPNTNRSKDLTPTKHPDDKSGANSGGGEQFISFLEKELMPYIDSTYRTQPFKMLIGHSLGGLTVMNAFINHTELFNSYISIDPTLEWDNQNLLKTVKQVPLQKNLTGKSLYVSMSNTMQNKMSISDVENDTTRGTLYIRSILEMDKYLKSQNPNGLNYASKYYENDNHNTVPLITEYDAFRFIFKMYPLSLSISPKEYNDSTINIANAIALHCKRISEQLGYTVLPPENFLNAEAYRLLRLKQLKKAEGCFKFYVDSYPNSFNAYNAYGDYLLTIGDTSIAIEQFKKALSLKEYPPIRKKLNKLLE